MCNVSLGFFSDRQTKSKTQTDQKDKKAKRKNDYDQTEIQQKLRKITFWVFPFALFTSVFAVVSVILRQLINFNKYACPPSLLFLFLPPAYSYGEKYYFNCPRNTLASSCRNLLLVLPLFWVAFCRLQSNCVNAPIYDAEKSMHSSCPKWGYVFMFRMSINVWLSSQFVCVRLGTAVGIERKWAMFACEISRGYRK